MSEFFKRWSARKREAQQAANEQPQPLDMEGVSAPQSDLVEPSALENTLPSAEVSTDKGSAPCAGSNPAAEPSTAVSDKPALPDREALRAMFRGHQPDGLDDYTQDFSQPELLPAALTAGLRNWLVAPTSEQEADQTAPSPITPGEEADDATSPAAALPQDHDKGRDILANEVGQNVPANKAGMEPLGS
ncbi:DUF3306 domain-containing protein [Aeromonas enteropelogenes]|uniref:DUF3306 domain-containing protein n=1 Tax=Aeromonas enteropelogenes TaxID=29489 RepID=UPI00191D13C8|nr:DUF3306 domain-containing protein [Aeromonas enteropelogenes]MBL0455827.1 DUF3306 domain-containing protein [Aeromonas enteropelogenes]